MIAGDKARVMVTVPVAPTVAFDVFTQETDLWWRRGVRYRVAGRNPGTLAFECKQGGRLFEQYEGPAGTRVHEAGAITIWEPPARLEFEWRGSNFAPGEVDARARDVRTDGERWHPGHRRAPRVRGIAPGSPGASWRRRPLRSSARWGCGGVI